MPETIPDAIIWTCIITAGVLAALMIFDGCVELGMRFERWREGRR